MKLVTQRTRVAPATDQFNPPFRHVDGLDIKANAAISD